MTELWDELWIRKVTPQEREDWLYEVKAEGDSLKKNAENWNLLFGDMDDPFYDIMKRLECLHEIERRWMEASIMMGRKVLEHQTIAESEIAYQRELKDKLEAVKTHLTKWVSGHSDWQMGRMSQWKKELDEILEDEKCYLEIKK